jgi:hypothetical protein
LLFCFSFHSFNQPCLHQIVFHRVFPQTDTKQLGLTPLKLVIMSATLRVSDFVDNPRLFPTAKHVAPKPPATIVGATAVVGAAESTTVAEAVAPTEVTPTAGVGVRGGGITAPPPVLQVSSTQLFFLL